LTSRFQIIDERIKRETDTDEKIKLILEKSLISTTKIAVIEEALLLATENDLKFQEAESYFEIGKVNLELNKLGDNYNLSIIPFAACTLEIATFTIYVQTISAKNLVQKYENKSVI
jgi:hypothetical protein